MVSLDQAGLYRRAMGSPCESIGLSSMPASPAVVPAGTSFRVVNGTGRIAEELVGSVLLLGNFDGFHRGHEALPEAARRAAPGRPLGIMAVEPHPRQLLVPNAPPFRITSARVKHEAFRRLGFAFAFSPRFDYAFASQAAEAFVEDVLVRALRVADVVVGEGYRFGHRRRGDVSLLRRMGAELGFGVTEVATVRRQDAVCSSTLVRAMIRAGDIDAASALLATPWRVEVSVVHHASGAIEIGWPEEVLTPPPGRYRVRIGRFDRSMPLAAGTLTLDGRLRQLLPDHALSPAAVPGALVLEVGGR